MNGGESVRHAIDDWLAGKPEAAMMHACNAVDGTAKKIHARQGVVPNTLYVIARLRRGAGTRSAFVGTQGPGERSAHAPRAHAYPRRGLRVRELESGLTFSRLRGSSVAA